MSNPDWDAKEHGTCDCFACGKIKEALKLKEKREATMRKIIPAPAACAWCSGKIPEDKIEPDEKHQFCSDSCSKAFGIW